jgi:hypothetical protein
MILDRVRVTQCTVGPAGVPFPSEGFGAAMSTNCGDADVTIRDSLFDENELTGAAAPGGAIWWAGRDMTIVNTTFSGNTAVGSGGAIWALPNAGSGGEMTLRSVTFSDNAAGSGAAIFGAGGGLVTIENSALVHSVSGGNCGGTVTSAGYNLSDDASCAFAGAGDQTDVPSLLGPLRDNGGPTDTHSFPLGSLLRDAGNPLGCTDETGAPLAADQRGAPRPLGLECDTGAVEADPECSPEPAASCAVAAKAQLRIANGADPAKRQLAWSWKKGDPVTLPELGDPSALTDYLLCVYDDVDDAAQLALQIAVAPSDAWKAAGTKGWKYKDKTGASDGVQSVALKVGAAGKSGAQVAARGPSLPDLRPNDASELFDQDSAVTVQLVNGDGACFTSEFLAAGTKHNDATRFDAKAP